MPSNALGDSLVRFLLSGCPVASCRENESTDSAPRGNIGLSMVMVVARDLPASHGRAPATGRHREGENTFAKTCAMAFTPKGYCIAVALPA